MKTKNLILSILIFGFFIIPVKSQKVYPVTSGEIIFSQNQSAFTSDFMQQYPGAALVGSNVRFTMVINIGQYMHFDINNNLGFYSGLAVRNIGMITDETLPQTVTLTNQTVNYSNYNIVRRQYTLGIPLALKLGSFKDHFYLFGGGEYELAFVYKEKYWTDTFDRSGAKTKMVTWFGSQTPTLLPSVFGGIQFPGGFNVKFTYYMTDFLNSGYKNSKNNQEGAIYSISDLSRYQKSQVFFLSLCWQFDTSDMAREF
jgi:hypothetical protein